MTQDRALKEAIRRRMEQTGEKYTEARRVLTTSVGSMSPGESRTVVVAWRLDDPAVQDDGRFWTKVAEEIAESLGHPAGSIVPAGMSLGHWRGRAQGDELELTNPTRLKKRISLARWRDADPESTYVIPSFQHAPAESVGLSREEVDRIDDERFTKPGATRIKLKPSQEVKDLEAERDQLQHQLRAATDRGDDRLATALSLAVETKAEELLRADFPNRTRGWDLSRAIRDGPETFILDWTTGY